MWDFLLKFGNFLEDFEWIKEFDWEIWLDFYGIWSADFQYLVGGSFLSIEINNFLKILCFLAKFWWNSLKKSLHFFKIGCYLLKGNGNFIYLFAADWGKYFSFIGCRLIWKKHSVWRFSFIVFEWLLYLRILCCRCWDFVDFVGWWLLCW